MGKVQSEVTLGNFTKGLNTQDDPLKIDEAQLTIARNVLFNDNGSVQSINGFLQYGNKIKVNGIPSIKILGGVIFQRAPYILASNGTAARVVRLGDKTSAITIFADDGDEEHVVVTSVAHGLYEGDSIGITGTTNYNGTYSIGTVTTDTFRIVATWVSDDATGTVTSQSWIEVSSVNFEPDTRAQMVVYANEIWFVNGLVTNSNILHFIDISNTLTGLTTSSGLTSGINRLCLHQERMWIASGNKLYVSKQYPTGDNDDWDASRVYSGSDAPGLIQLDNDTEDSIKNIRSFLGKLIMYRTAKVHVMTGETILTSTIQKAFNSRGTTADFSVSESDSTTYFLSRDGVKQFNGVSTQDQMTQFDTISTVGIDRSIHNLISAMPQPTNAVGYAFKDRYYLSDVESTTYVFDEISGGWSVWDIGGPELFLEMDGILYCAEADKFSEVNADTTASIPSHVKTKDLELGTKQLYKSIEKLAIYLRRFSTQNTVILECYLDSASTPSQTFSIVVQGSGVRWDELYKWDEGVRWDSGSLNSLKASERKIGSCYVVAFGVKAAGTDRFSLGSLNILYEVLRREI